MGKNEGIKLGLSFSTSASPVEVGIPGELEVLDAKVVSDEAAWVLDEEVDITIEEDKVIDVDSGDSTNVLELTGRSGWSLGLVDVETVGEDTGTEVVEAPTVMVDDATPS